MTPIAGAPLHLHLSYGLDNLLRVPQVQVRLLLGEAALVQETYAPVAPLYGREGGGVWPASQCALVKSMRSHYTRSTACDKLYSQVGILGVCW